MMNLEWTCIPKIQILFSKVIKCSQNSCHNIDMFLNNTKTGRMSLISKDKDDNIRASSKIFS